MKIWQFYFHISQYKWKIHFLPHFSHPRLFSLPVKSPSVVICPVKSCQDEWALWRGKQTVQSLETEVSWSMSGLIPTTGPIDIIPGEGPIIGIMEGLPMQCVGIIPNEEDPGDWVELGSFPLQEEEQRVEREASFLTEMQPLFCQSGFEPLFHPFLMVDFHILFVSPSTAVCGHG